ncbi:DNA polymerase III subunit delta' [Virgibacillus sp. YIM 98842]|jgi:DNA polymerase-3 subunit delta'|uniref:DNA polymerase III subunit delta' n=1 Tax=Virgibacillus sp. YIM 98842 TaxID=2663533 RepID=UPI0013DC9A58|nr:DNA polymerase III subunit delta' [Virgibacillus sp. YIM 98842]
MKTWSEVAEVQPLAGRIITNSIKKGRVSHAYLIQGERGTGKEAIASLIAKGLFCTDKDGLEPCHTCQMCKRIDSGNHPDVHWIVPDGQSIKIEQIKNLQKEFTYSGLESNKKVYIIKAADTLTLNAANRILKFLEEPSRQTTAIMLTENSSAIIPTIRSRCQVIDLQPLNPKKFQKKLMDEGMPEQHAVLMSALTNSIDEAVAWKSDDWFASALKLVVQLIEKLVNYPEDAYLFIHSSWMPHFKERSEQEQGLDVMLLAWKDILYYHIGNEEQLVFFRANSDLLQRAALSFSQESIIDNLQAILQAKRKLKQNVHPTLVMEQLTLQLKR